MNIFALNRDPYLAAASHCDKHVVKMIVEYAQLLSTAHRLLDGGLKEWRIQTDSTPGVVGRVKTFRFLELDGENCKLTHYTDTFGRVKYSVEVEFRKCYNATHANHPCAIWARASDTNYHWLVQLFEGCLREYTKRYKKIHATEKLLEFFRTAPKHIPHGVMAPFALAMPDQYKVDDEILSYQNYYVGDKSRFAKWTNTPAPKWFIDGVKRGASDFQRTR